jgi:mono/diheme cytochrome c family protein
MKRIFPIFVAAAPVLVPIACVPYDTSASQTAQFAPARPIADPPTNRVTAGRALFLKNCAHCHGADAHGNEGPDLYQLDWTDQQIATRIYNGKPGQMTAFRGKLSQDQVNALITYVRTSK